MRNFGYKFRRRAVLVKVCVLLFLALPAVAEPVNENRVRAAFLYNAAKFVDWSDKKPSPLPAIGICVLSGDDLFREFENLQGRSIRSIPVVTRRIDADNFSASDCDIIYVSNDFKKNSQTTEKIKQLSILTVGESRQFARDVGVMALVAESNRMTFVVNNEAAVEAGVRFGSQLLSVAKLVSRSDHREDIAL